MKKIIWVVVLVALGLGLWKAGVYFYHSMEEEEAARQMIMEKQANQRAEDIAAPAAQGLVNKARNLERKTQESEQDEQQ